MAAMVQQAQPQAGHGQGIAERRTWPSWQSHLVFWPVLASGLAFDLWTKKAVFERVGLGQALDIIPGFLRFATVLNNGAAFSLASGRQPILIAISCVAFIVILGLFLFGGRKPLMISFVLGLFGCGVLGNLWDRAFNHGLVRDFIDVYIGSHHWPTFNVADSMLCVAVGLLIIAGPILNRRETK
jgi:signal peptidase II